jgi:uncharacterized protein (TIGR00730 family)
VKDQAGARDDIPLAYRSAAFLDSDDARPVRILAEYLAPLAAFRRLRIRDTIVFFGSSRAGPSSPLGHYLDDARRLARLVTEWAAEMPSRQHQLVVCSGGGGGIMEAANRRAVEAGGRTIGLNIRLPHEQRPNRYLAPDLTFEFHYFFMRKLWFTYLARAVVVFPGGFGTLDELFEMLTLTQTGKLDREILVLLYGSSYWNEIIDFDSLVRHEVISQEDRDLIRFVDDPDTALRLLQEGIREEPESPGPAFAKSTTAW